MTRATEAHCEVVYARKLAGELGFVQLTPTKIYEDNQGALALVKKMQQKHERGSKRGSGGGKGKGGPNKRRRE